MLVHSLRACHFFRRRPFHQEWQWNEERDNHTKDKERTDKGKHIRLRINHLLQLSERMLARSGSAETSADGGLLQPSEIAVEEDVAMMEVRNDVDTADLPVRVDKATKNDVPTAPPRLRAKLLIPETWLLSSGRMPT